MTTLTESSFKDAVRTYIELYDELMASQKTLKVLRQKKDELGKAILEFMKHNKIDEFQVPDGKLCRRASRKTESLKKEYIINSLKAALGDEQKVDALMLQMNSHRNVVEGESLRRTRQGKTTADR